MKSTVKFISLALLVVLGGCTMQSDVANNRLIQKRKYNKGWHLNLGGSSNMAKAKPSNTKLEKIERKVTNLLAKPDLLEKRLAKYAKKLTVPGRSQLIPLVKETVEKEDPECDLIIFRDGEEAEAKVLEINPDNVKYKLCDNLDGPVFFEKRSKILMIKYVNGTKTVFEKDGSIEEELRELFKGDDSNDSDSVAEEEVEYTGKPEKTSGKSQLVALALCIFLGAFSAHRFYLGHTTTAILQIAVVFLTCGLGLAWVVVDLVNIITDQLRAEGDLPYDDYL